ncbi:MAG: hypothetical protein U5K74_07110 [Gemmatimonadaceae bacterium]|nr:hypothetical protein [Gemmatimonadaceae bacterium]
MLAGLFALSLIVTDTLRVVPPVIDTVTAATGMPSDSGDVPAVSGTPYAAHVMFGRRLDQAQSDTTVLRPATGPVEYSDWYGRRVAIHRVLSWTMLPLFAVSYYTGERLARDGRAGSPDIVRRMHPYAAGGAAAVFGVNTVTGLWNLWDARKDPEGRTRRILHSALFLVADAGFAFAGSIGRDGRENGAIRDRHRTIALSSMGVSTAGWLVMLIGQ